MQALLQYPELILAGLFSLILLFAVNYKNQPIHFPDWLADPARSLLLLSPQRYLNWINKSLVQANWGNDSIANFASYKLYPCIFSLIFAFTLPLYMVLIIAILVWLIPDVFLLYSVKHRQQEIRYALPQALDLMVLCVDAGLGLDATLQRITLDSTGINSTLNDELKVLSREILLGMDRERAYQELYNRTGVDELKSLGSALTQANKLGLSIARILRTQSEYIRKKQSQKAEEKALKMPIYMAFPLWFCIMPCLMLLVLGPSLIKFYTQLHAAGSTF